MLFFYLSLQVFQDIIGSRNSQISHNQHFFQFLIKIIVNMGKAAENAVDA